MVACLQTTPLTDTHTKEPVNGTEAHAHPHVHASKPTHTHTHTRAPAGQNGVVCGYPQG